MSKTIIKDILGFDRDQYIDLNRFLEFIETNKEKIDFNMPLLSLIPSPNFPVVEALTGDLHTPELYAIPDEITVINGVIYLGNK